MFDISPFVAISSESLHRNTCFIWIVLQIYFIVLNLAFIWWYYYCDNAVFVFLLVAHRGAVTGLCISVRIWGVHHWPRGQRLGELNDVTRPTSPPSGKAFHHCAHVCLCVITVSISLPSSHIIIQNEFERAMKMLLCCTRPDLFLPGKITILLYSFLFYTSD